ncbi:TonB-dependent receptor [Duganella sp. BJB488]|uniref:TonB-dependent receptor domain-containing protein n=1 Tax=unclassified Duganella TaxID=2636909 RepID=UPI000E34617B|nr:MULTISPECIES: TonB-dependent receptor [unclassified Duganella]RFP11760.1 TonB-dependent receptor [Duganella sp. BJB489]RFP15528.1 TonB-dependent receptor [Duganella sp. BJB488]RFP30475.1 TonB-dependent receptor [Duganella sp. BJB480]
MAAITSGARHTAAPFILHAVTLAVLTALLPAHAADAPATPALGEILVKAKRDDSSNTRNGATTVIDAEQIGKNNAIDLANLARYSPLISVPSAASGSGNIWDGAGNTGINIRGAEGNRVSLELDGIALPDAAPKPDANSTNAFGIGRDYFDPETFREVRIGSGTSPAGAGTPGIGGAVSFITKTPEEYLATRKLYADYKFGYTSDHAQRMHAVTAAAQLSDHLQGLIVGVHRDGEQGKSKGGTPQNPDDWSSDAVLAKLNWTLARDQKLNFTIDNYKAQHDLVFANKLAASYPEGATQDARTERTRYSIEHHYTPGAGLLFDTLDTRAYTQNASVVDQTRASYITGGQPYLRNISTGFYNNSKGLALDATRQLAPLSMLSYGISYEQQESRRPWLEDRTVIKTGAHQVTMKNRMADMDTDKLAAYLRGEFGFTLLGHQATLTPGLRAERRKLKPKNLAAYLIAVPSAAREIREETDSFLTPSLNLSVELAPGFSTYAQYSRGTRLPTAAERTGTYDSFSYTAAGNAYAVLGNPNLQKETSNAFEIGVKGAPANGVELSASAFYTRYSNLIEYAAQPLDPVNYPTITFGLYRPENVGKANTKGIEVSSRFLLGQWAEAMKGYSVALAGGISRGTAENRLTGKQADLPSIQPYKANATFAYDDPALRGGAAFVVSTVRGKKAADDVITDASGARFAVPGSTVMDLTAYWNIGKHAVLNAGIYNLGDKKYWDYASARSLPAGTSAATLADIERYVRPGRNYAVNLKVIY